MRGQGKGIWSWSLVLTARTLPILCAMYSMHEQRAWGVTVPSDCLVNFE